MLLFGVHVVTLATELLPGKIWLKTIIVVRFLICYQSVQVLINGLC